MLQDEQSKEVFDAAEAMALRRLHDTSDAWMVAQARRGRSSSTRPEERVGPAD